MKSGTSQRYKKLAAGASSATRSRLYLAGDHLLNVRGSYVEEYRRFFFKDIKASLIRKNSTRTAVIGVGSLILGIITLIGAFSGEPGAQAFAVFTGILLVTMLVFLIPALIQGGYAELYLVTSVQSEQLEAVRTMKKAEKIVAIIEAQTDEDYRQIDMAAYRARAETQRIKEAAGSTRSFGPNPGIPIERHDS